MSRTHMGIWGYAGLNAKEAPWNLHRAWKRRGSRCRRHEDRLSDLQRTKPDDACDPHVTHDYERATEATSTLIRLIGSFVPQIPSIFRITKSFEVHWGKRGKREPRWKVNPPLILKTTEPFYKVTLTKCLLRPTVVKAVMKTEDGKNKIEIKRFSNLNFYLKEFQVTRKHFD